MNMKIDQLRRAAAAVFLGLVLAATGASAAAAADEFRPTEDCAPEWCDKY